MVEAVFPVNLALFCFLFPIDDVKDHFEIDSQSGEIKVTAGFDQHRQTNYAIGVVATDNGAAPVEQTALVNIQVTLQGHQYLNDTECNDMLMITHKNDILTLFRLRSTLALRWAVMIFWVSAV